jgi:nucleoside-diphosphate-sugar epimerase
MDLVTGGTGIVGVHVLRELLRRGRTVRALRRPGTNTGIVEKVFAHYGDAALAERTEWVDGDVLDVVALEEAMYGVERVFHCAAEVSFAPRDRALLMRVNRDGTANVVNACLAAGVQLLGHVSSTASLGGEDPSGTIHEDTPWDAGSDNSPYAVSKYEAELEVERGRAEGLPAVIVNPCVVLGPGRGGRSSLTLPERLARGTSFVPPGANGVVDARDVAEVLIDLCDRHITEGRHLVVGANVRYKELFDALSDAFGKPRPTRPLRPWMLQLAWRVEAVRSRLMGRRPLVTRYTVASSLKERRFAQDKLRTALDRDLRGLPEMVDNVSAWVRGR